MRSVALTIGGVSLSQSRVKEREITRLKKMEWKKVERSNAHDFKVEAELEGTLKSKVPSKFEGNDYLVTKEDGTDVLVFGKTALQNQLESLELGTKVKIVYTGDQKNENSGRTFEGFDVFTA